MKNYTEIVCVIDRSGSMEVIRDDAIGGFNTFLKEQQKEPGDATLTFVQFDNQYEVIYENMPLDQVKPLDGKTYVPRGTTALLDAIGLTIDNVGKRLAAISEGNRPAKVVFAILTDGYENASTKYTGHGQVKKMIDHQREKYSWEFIYLGANQDAIKEADKIGVHACDAFNFARTGQGVRAGYSRLSGATASYRTK